MKSEETFLTFFDKNKTYVIAEAGSNFNQNLSTAMKLIETAKDCGADAIKFQLFKAEILYPEKTGIAFQTTKKNEFPRIWLEELLKLANNIEIDFLATPFDNEAVDILSDLDIKLFKFLFAAPKIKCKVVCVFAGRYDLPNGSGVLVQLVQLLRRAG